MICSGTGGIVWIHPETGASGTLLDAIEGEPISGVNDICPDGRGGLFFGTVDHRSMLSGKDFFGNSELCRLAPDGSVSRLHGGMQFSNGMGLSPDGGRVYIVDSGVGPYVTDIAPDGLFGETRLLCDLPGIDGMTVDAEGALWGALIQTGDIARITPDGTIDRKISVPGGHPVSLCFGGPDYRDLYVTTAAPGAGEAALDHSRIPSVPRTAGIYRARCDVPGMPAGRTAFKLTGG
jgi:sugar lactone lactonase YvrE